MFCCRPFTVKLWLFTCMNSGVNLHITYLNEAQFLGILIVIWFFTCMNSLSSTYWPCDFLPVWIQVWTFRLPTCMKHCFRPRPAMLVVVRFFTGMISFSSTSPTIYLLNMAPYDFRMNNLAMSHLGTWPAKCFAAECACFLLFLSIYIQLVTIIIAWWMIASDFYR
jgi:hypothetical protein